MESPKTIVESYEPTDTVAPKSNQAYLSIKRFQDIVLSTLALIVLSPLLLLVSILIVLDDPHGGPIFAQERVGKNGQIFKMYKFRTMCVNAEEQLEALKQDNEMDRIVFKIKNDPRITRFGSFLRRMSLDELPQLINILKGDMSIVGPRPALPQEVAQYTQYERQRLNAAPGLTCYWQVQPNRYKLSMDEWVALDLRYIRERNWWLDWWIIWKTVGTVLRGEGE